jgi:peptidoglycan/xylan/chitin deacetylase (PgdA/CDA1 family)
VPISQGLRQTYRALVSPPWVSDRWGGLIYHEIADEETSLTAGLGVTHKPCDFAARLEYLSKIYRFVGLDGVDGVPGKKRFQQTPLLLTFDDAYASVRQIAAPICSDLGIPAVFFVNGSLLDNRNLALDNLLAHVANTLGFSPIVKIAGMQFRSLHHLISSYVSQLGPQGRDEFGKQIIQETGISPGELLKEFRPYISSSELRELLKFGFEIGNHTWGHVHLRSLDPTSVRLEVAGNKDFLERVTGEEVKAFAFPYGNRRDATGDALSCLKETGHKRAFVVHQRFNNGSRTDPYMAMRIGIRATTNFGTFLELEVLPRLRALLDFFRKVSGTFGPARISS